MNDKPLTWTSDIPAAPDRPDDGHKGTFGTVLVVGGCKTMIGAPALTAGAALRVGVGLTKLAMPASVLGFAITIEPGATGVALDPEEGDGPGEIDAADPDAKAVWAIGPGMGPGSAARRLVGQLVPQARRMVVDADGLNHLGSLDLAEPVDGRDLVMTPHPGEFKRLAEPLGIEQSATDPEQRPHAAAALARAYGGVAVLKGRHTIVTDGERVYRNETGNVALATAGSGDVLTGVIAGLMAQGLSGFDAAVLGTYIHGCAADVWARDFGPSGLSAPQLVQRIPRAMQERRSE